MDKLTTFSIALAILGLVAIALFAVFRGKGIRSITIGKVDGKVTACNLGKVDARKIEALFNATGGVAMGDVPAKGDVAAQHTPGQTAPKS